MQTFKIKSNKLAQTTMNFTTKRLRRLERFGTEKNFIKLYKNFTKDTRIAEDRQVRLAKYLARAGRLANPFQ